MKQQTEYPIVARRGKIKFTAYLDRESLELLRMNKVPNVSEYIRNSIHKDFGVEQNGKDKRERVSRV